MKNCIIILIAMLLFAGCKKEKTGIPEQLNKAEYKVEVDSVPMPAGGMAEIQNNVVYPVEAKNKGISGKVMVLAFIDENGIVDKVEILNGNDSLLNKAAADAVKKTKFNPGKLNSKNVKTQIAIPIVFKLDKREKTNSVNKDSLEKVLEKEHPEYLSIAEEMPTIKGGITALLKYVQYPEEAKKKGIEGKVYVSVLIDENGHVVEARSVKEANPLLIEAALKAVKQTQFVPGKEKGKKVKVQILMPITFKLK